MNGSLFILLLLVFSFGCVIVEENTNSSPFNRREALSFANLISEDSLSVYDFHYLYNGGGVAIEDFNNDGHLDIFLGANMTSSSLYINDRKGSFYDVTLKSGIKTDQWVNGISVVDINHDMLMDIYLSIGGPDCDGMRCKNLLFINHSDEDEIVFVESAEEYGLAITGYSQQALFVDVDLDGDLDLYQLQNHVDPTNKNYPKPKRHFSKKSYDKLYINKEIENDKIIFEDMSELWNVRLPGFGLGIAMTDINSDGYPDIYIANDFISDDILYVNQGGKYFIDKSHELLKHTSYNSMGVDISDIDCDGLEDIIVVDMLPYDNLRQKTMLGSINFDKYQLSLQEGYNTQIVKNTIQIHNGKGRDGLIYPFSEIGTLLDMHDTDWSWAPLIADFDNDLDQDVYISNGYGKNITDLDFVNYNASRSGFGPELQFSQDIKSQIKSLEEVKLPNFYFESEPNGGFRRIKSSKHTITNGVAYGDLDGDGDLDLVLNNLNEPAEILYNNSNSNYIKLRLSGDSLNTKAIGAQVILHLDNGQTLLKRLSPIKSYLSCMPSELVFGLGAHTVQKIDVIWPDHTQSVIDTSCVNETIELSYFDLHRYSRIKVNSKSEPLLFYGADTLMTKETFASAHDFSIQPLLLKSRNNDSFRLCHANKSNSVYLSFDNYIYSLTDKTPHWEKIIDLEKDNIVDIDCEDLDGDSLEELVVLTQYQEKKGLSIYKRNGQLGNWKLIDEIALAKEANIVSIGKLDDKNELYIIVGCEATPNSYPLGSQTPYRIFAFNKRLRETGVELDFPEYYSISDMDFSKAELSVAVGEWHAPLIWQKKYQTWSQCHISELDSLKGLWQAIEIGDLDNDGDEDIVLGNIGLNNKYLASINDPMFIVTKDLDQNGSLDPILSLRMKDGKLYPYHSRDDIAKQIPSIKNWFNSYEDFGAATFKDVLIKFKGKVEFLEVNFLETVLLENTGTCRFEIKRFPSEVQYSMVNDILIKDINRDGLKDILMTTNYDNVETHNGKFDGLNGVCLMNRGNFHFDYLSSAESGFYLPNQANEIINLQDEILITERDKLISLKLTSTKQ